MRIIAGNMRGKGLQAPEGMTTRPFPDRLKGSLFQILENHWGRPLAVDSTLDLFAGSGSLGLEAVSRGATGAIFVEEDRAALHCLRRNVESVQRVLGPERPLDIWDIDAISAIKRLQETRRSIMLFLADPPFRRGWAGPVLEWAPQILAESGMLILRRHEEEEAPIPPPGLTLVERRQYGFHVIEMWRRDPTQPGESNSEAPTAIPSKGDD